MRLARTEAAERVAALRARAGRKRGRVQEEVQLAVLVKVRNKDLLHVGERPRLARVAREARVDMILVQSPAKVVVDGTDSRPRRHRFGCRNVVLVC